MDTRESRHRTDGGTPRRVFLAFAGLLGTALVVAPALAEPVTYQGRLESGGVAADGAHDFTFGLFAEPTTGTALLSQQFEDVPVEDGVFTVELHIPAGVLPDVPRWVEIGVRAGASTGAFTTLTPRQKLTAAPFAIRDLSEPWVLQSGALSYGDGPVRIGRDFQIGSEVFGIGADTSNFAGMYASTTGETGRPFYGYSAGGDIDAYHYFDGNVGQLRFNLNNFEPLSMTMNAVGINRAPPTTPGLGLTGRLEVSGNVGISGDLDATSGDIDFGNPLRIFRDVAGQPLVAFGSAFGGVDIEHFGTLFTEQVEVLSLIESPVMRSGAFEYPAPEPRSLVVNFSEFVLAGTSTTERVVHDSAQRLAYATGGFDRLIAPVSLPQGATITGMTLYAEDELSTRNLDVALITLELDAPTNSGAFLLVAAATSLPFSASVQVPITSANVTPPGVTVDNGDQMYYVQVVPRQSGGFLGSWPGDDGLAVRAVKILYTVDEAD